MDALIRLTVLDRGHEYAGVVRVGESWRVAANRTVAALHHEPVPLDLAKRPLRFQIEHDLAVVVRPMTRGDLPDVTRWRQAEHVHRWWRADGEPTAKRVEEQYSADIDGGTPTRMWVVEVNGRSVGFVQDYRIRDYPEYAVLAPDPEAIGVDYAIGEAAWVGRGLGVRMLWAWLAKARRHWPDAQHVFAAPSHRNTASLRLLDKLGFERGLWFDEPQSDGSVDTVVGCTLDLRKILG